jgi:hypothetical protein
MVEERKVLRRGFVWSEYSLYNEAQRSEEFDRKSLPWPYHQTACTSRQLVKVESSFGRPSLARSSSGSSPIDSILQALTLDLATNRTSSLKFASSLSHLHKTSLHGQIRMATSIAGTNPSRLHALTLSRSPQARMGYSRRQKKIRKRTMATM